MECFGTFPLLLYQARQLLTSYSSSVNVPLGTPPLTNNNTSSSGDFAAAATATAGSNSSQPVTFYALALFSNGTKVRMRRMWAPCNCPNAAEHALKP
jgi:hypothetical protein